MGFFINPETDFGQDEQKTAMMVCSRHRSGRMPVLCKEKCGGHSPAKGSSGLEAPIVACTKRLGAHQSILFQMGINPFLFILKIP